MIYLQYGYGSVRFLLMLCENSDYKCFFSPTMTPRDGNCLLHGIKLILERLYSKWTLFSNCGWYRK